MILSEITSKIIELKTSDRRLLIGVAGPPAAGKSTIAEALCDRLISEKIAAKVVPMDGFHLDNTVLDERNLRHRKGSPETFDAAGFVSLVRALKEADRAVSIPGFDRQNDCVVPDQDEVGLDQEVLLVEGNYLFLDQEPWRDLFELFDFSVFLNPGIKILEQRLIERWLQYDHTLDEARERAMINDIPNARTVVENSRAADVVISDQE